MSSFNKNRKNDKLNGFTIVELLVVIVVIGILAAITIVSYSGVTAKARETKIVNIVKSYQTALQMYYTESGAYPTERFCLGSSSDYPANSDFDAGVCMTNGTNNMSANDTINSVLESYMGSHISGAYDTRTDLDGVTYRGVFYIPGWDSSIGGLWFDNTGSNNCPIGSSMITTNGSVACALMLE